MLRPKVKIIFRGDGDFCRWQLLRWCGHYEVGYVAGLAKNKRSNHLITPLKDEAVVDLVFGQVEIPSFDSSTAV